MPSPDPLEVLSLGLFRTTGLSVTTQGLVSGSGAVHPRTQIRNYIVKRLKAEALDPDRVHRARPRPLKDDQLPAIFVYTPDEESTVRDEGPRTLLRVTEVRIHVLTTELDGLDDFADAVAFLVEHIVGADRTLGGNANDVALTGSQAGIATDGNQSIAHVLLVFEVEYTCRVAELAPDELKAAYVDWDVGPQPDAQIEAEDRLTYP